MNVRTRRIRSGSFGMLSNQRNDYKESIVIVNRTFTPSSSDTDEKITKSFNLAYSIYNAHLVSSEKKPIVFIHGGPGIPSDYLKPLANKFKDRSIILYDQIGCGKSSEPSDINAYSIDFATDDLDTLISHVGLKKFHLVGHSFGGLIAFEYLKRLVGNYPARSRDQECLSLILSSTPFSIKGAEQESDNVLKKLEGKLSSSEAISVFHNNFVCRTEIIPAALQESYSKRGRIWQGTTKIQDHVVRLPLILKEMMPPVLAIRGEYDFVSQSFAIDDWIGLFESNSTQCQAKMLLGCSHYCMLEDIENYSKTVSDFVSSIESKFC
jgi:proline-specific peptidase